MPDFKLLGPMEMVDDRGQPHIPVGPKIRQVLALLALNAGKVVEVDLLIHELWSENEPKDVVKTLQTHIYHLRRILLRMGPAVAQLVVTRAPGYLLRADPGRVDALVFPLLVQR